MTKDLLPNGSVVLLKNADKRLMICGWYPMSKAEQVYDYASYLYPEGYIDSEQIYLFNHDDIERVDFIGFVDAEYQMFASAVSIEMEKQDIS
jgi:hypothetical protein